MLRKLVINGLAAVAVMLLAGASLAATGNGPALLNGSDDPEATQNDDGDPSEDVREQVALRLPNETATAAVRGEFRGGDDDEGPDEDSDSFGQQRAAEVTQFGECMSSFPEDVPGHERLQACSQFHPEPADPNAEGGPAFEGKQRAEQNKARAQQRSQQAQEQAELRRQQAQEQAELQRERAQEQAELQRERAQEQRERGQEQREQGQSGASENRDRGGQAAEEGRSNAANAPASGGGGGGGGAPAGAGKAGGGRP